MKKRLRKKLRLREFQEMGFSVKFELSDLANDEAYLAFWDKLVVAIEANNLLMGGGLNDFFVQTNSRRTATEADRESIATWLQQQPEVSAINVSPLIDAWHGNFD
jgi:uncharacterized protein YggL (DUF469 family)